ncbi:MAG: hypothetical protein KKH41_03575 [Candidatus Thermoplasmatota archaeon]|nr:hypothetical protein [Candidatus Thermoplasmatota archaeon]MBU4070811.1 hypothetical protein [Candidatus Thermoplasmatota archaeon]MBU4591645.1 hypothetical protein [Candidatus Thermoplasmatota archaeon]
MTKEEILANAFIFYILMLILGCSAIIFSFSSIFGLPERILSAIIGILLTVITIIGIKNLKKT